MPLAIFESGTQTTSIDMLARPLIPGIEPGGSQAGEDFKPALLIRRIWVVLSDFTTVATADYYRARCFLKMSQDQDLDPGILLGPAVLSVAQSGATANAPNSVDLDNGAFAFFPGTIWVPRFVGIRIQPTIESVEFDLYLDYEVIQIPWMDWFIRWDYLDNVVNNTREY